MQFFHAVNMERAEDPMLIFRSQKIQHLIFRRSGESKEGDVLVFDLDDQFLSSACHLGRVGR